MIIAPVFLNIFIVILSSFDFRVYVYGLFVAYFSFISLCITSRVLVMMNTSCMVANSAFSINVHNINEPGEVLSKPIILHLRSTIPIPVNSSGWRRLMEDLARRRAQIYNHVVSVARRFPPEIVAVIFRCSMN